jgi:hypothetical protein
VQWKKAERVSVGFPPWLNKNNAIFQKLSFQKNNDILKATLGKR